MNGPLQPPGAPQTLPVDVTNELLRWSRSRKSTAGDPLSTSINKTLSGRKQTRRWRSHRCGSRHWRRTPWKSGRGAIIASRAVVVALGILAMHCLSGIPHVLSEYNYCLGKANQADTGGGEVEGDGVLDPEEFATMVYNVTNGTLDFFTAPGAVPDAVTASYSSLLPQGTTGLTLSNANLTLEFCTGLYEALLSFYGLSFNGVSCLSAVEFGQGNNPRITSDEYARFVYKLSGGKFGSQEKGMLPDALPAPLADVFDVYGVFDFENATNEYYQGVCSETSVAILVSASYDPPRPPTPPPSGAPGTTAPTGMPVPTMPDDFRLGCQTALIVGDSIERDDQLTEDEYVRFISRLVPDGSVSASASYASLPAVLQTNFQTLATNQSYIDVAGSKPNSNPTAEQTTNLEHICEVTYASVIAYEDGASQASPAPSLSPNMDANSTATADDDLAFGWILTDEAYSTCKLSMMYSDLNRDNILDAYEYLRFINRMINSTTTTFANPADLPALFQSDFEGLSDGGSGIDVAGSKPAPSPTDDQDKHLKSVCRVTGKSISEYLGNGGSNNNGTSPMDPFLQECIDALSVADRDSNGVMDQSEYLRFVNKLTGSTFTDFDSLADALKANYETLSQGTQDGVSIDGVSDGTLTTTEREQVSYVCSETQTALNSSKTEIDDLNDLSEEDFQQCMKVLAVSDVNNNGWLEPIEYVEVVNLMTNQKFKGSAFSDLDKLFRVSYEKSLGSNPFVDVAGAKEGLEATDDQLKNLKSVCVGLLDTVHVFEKPTDKQLETCISLLQPRFLDDRSLSKDDYLWLVHKLAPEDWKNATSVEDLPFVVGDNYEWVKYGGNSIDLSKVGDGSALNVSELLNWTCTRTIVTIGLALDVVAESKGEALDFCTIPISFSDVNADDSLDRQEFQSLIDHFSGNAWSDDDFSTLDLSIQKLFNDYIDVRTDTIPIDGSKPGANTTEAESEYLKTFCGDVERAVQSARSNTLFHESCVVVLRFVDDDTDNKLSTEEYTAFLFDLAGLNALDQSFDRLDPELQSNYDRFKRESNSDQVILNSTTTVDNICAATKDSLGKVQEDSANPDESSGSSSIGLWAMAGIAAGIATGVFGSGVALYCCWTKRRDREKEKEVLKAQPECSPYSDYDPEAQGSLKPSSRSSGDGRTEDVSEASASEHFEDEPGNAVGTSNVAMVGAMEDATSEHFEDEHVAGTIEAHKAPVYVDNDYGHLQGDAVAFDADSFGAPNGDMEWNPPDSDFEEFQAFAAATPPKVDMESSSGPHCETVLTNEVTPVNPFEVPPEIGDEVHDLPRVNPFGEVMEADTQLVTPESPHRPSNDDSALSPPPEVESPVRSPGRSSVYVSAKSSPRRAPPSSPQRSTHSSSSHPLSPSGGSESTRERRNLYTSAKTDEQSEPIGLENTNSQRLESEAWGDEVMLVSPLNVAKKPSVGMEQKEGENELQVDHSDEESSESESESNPEDEDDAESDEEDSESEYDEGDDASSEAETIDDSLRPNRSTVDAQRQPHYKEIKELVAQLMPDELPNVDVMISQFAGNEEELLHTLQNMAAASPRAANADESGDSEDESSDDDDDDDDDDEGAEEESDDDGSTDEDENEEDDESDGEDDGNDDEGSDSDVKDEDEDGSDADPDDGNSEGESDVEESEGASESHDDGSASASSAASEFDASEESRKEAETEVAESVYDEESYYSEEVVESEDDEEVVESDDDDEETIDDEEETIQSEGEDEGSEDDESSSYESDSD